MSSRCCRGLDADSWAHSCPQSASAWEVMRCSCYAVDDDVGGDAPVSPSGSQERVAQRERLYACLNRELAVEITPSPLSSVSGGALHVRRVIVPPSSYRSEISSSALQYLVRRWCRIFTCTVFSVPRESPIAKANPHAVIPCQPLPRGMRGINKINVFGVVAHIGA